MESMKVDLTTELKNENTKLISEITNLKKNMLLQKLKPLILLSTT